MGAIKNYFLYMFDFVGVCNRKEFWIVFPLVLVIYALAIGLFFLGWIGQLFGILILILFAIPTISLIVRRLHDTDRSAKHLLWWLLPFVGVIIVLLLLTEKTKYIVQ